MILINLLPHREEARKRRRDAFNAGLVGAALVGGVIVAVIYLLYQAALGAQQEKNDFLQVEIKNLESQIKEISNIETEIAALKARQKAVEDLQSDRNSQVHLLNELSKQLPDGIYIGSVRQEGQNILLQGSAQSNERVSELLRNFSSGSTWFAKPELMEIQAGNVSLSPRDQRRVANFNMRVQLLKGSEVDKKNEAQGAKR